MPCAFANNLWPLTRKILRKSRMRGQWRDGAKMTIMKTPERIGFLSQCIVLLRTNPNCGFH